MYEEIKLSQLTFCEEMAITTHRQIYNKCWIKLYTSCPICSPGKGCNKNKDYIRNWKKFRKTQYKTK